MRKVIGRGGQKNAFKANTLEKELLYGENAKKTYQLMSK